MKFIQIMANDPYVTKIQELLWQEWGEANNRLFTDRLIISTLGNPLVPSTWACIVDGELAGTVSLFVIDLKCRQDLSPWVACLYVHPDYRNRGIGKSLLNLAEDVAKKAKYSAIYLLTHLENFYENAGWQFEGLEINSAGQQVRLYKKDLISENEVNTEVGIERATEEDAEVLLKVQKKAFSPLLERYKDNDFNPCCETLEQIKRNIARGYFYKIIFNGGLVGGIMVHQLEEQKWKLRIIFVSPELQGKGIAQGAIRLMEAIHSDVTDWILETPHDLYNNHHIYEKAGYTRTNEITPINEKLALVHYWRKG